VIEELRRQLKRDEAARGAELRPYRDTAGKLTIGWGRNLDDKGISVEEADYLLGHDIAEVMDLLGPHPWFQALNEPRQAVLANMCFNLGGPRFFGFVKMLAAVRMGDWTSAAEEMLASDWAHQVHGRAERLARQMRTGEWAY
jgi:lysozyme